MSASSVLTVRGVCDNRVSSVSVDGPARDSTYTRAASLSVSVCACVGASNRHDVLCRNASIRA